MSKFFAIILALTISVVSAHAAPSQSAPGTIYGILVEQGRVFFSTTGARSTMPACHTQGARWVFDANIPAGQAMMAALLTLQAQGKSINVVGTGNCNAWGDTETVEYIQQAN